MDIFRKKDVSKSRIGMKRHLKIHDLILLGIGAMVGTGIFTITGIGAANYAGPSLIISIIISALCVSMSALFTLNLLLAFRLMVGLIAISMLSSVSFRHGLLAG